MKKFFGEFKEFALKGNVVGLAVAVLIGAAFQAIIKSLTDNIISPLLGLLIGNNFDELTADFLGVSLGYGAFVTSIINFFIIAFVLFLVVKTMNKIIPEKTAAPAPKRLCPFCLSEIADDATRCPQCTSEL